MFKKIFVCLIGLTCTASTIRVFIQKYDEYKRQYENGYNNISLLEEYMPALRRQFYNITPNTFVKIIDEKNERVFIYGYKNHNSLPEYILNAPAIFEPSNNEIFIQILQIT